MIIRHKRTTTESSEINPRIMYLEYDTETNMVCHKDADGGVLKSWHYESVDSEAFRRFPQQWPEYWYNVPFDFDLEMDIGL
jgi:hypothetical protein